MKGQKVAHFTQVTCFENTLRIRRFIYPNFFRDQCVVEMIVLSRSIVLLGKAMYQSAFMSVEYYLNSVVESLFAGRKF